MTPVSSRARIIGANIRRIRTTRGMTRKALGIAIGHKNGGYISQVESGLRKPMDTTLERIAEALGTDTGALNRHYPKGESE